MFSTSGEKVCLANRQQKVVGGAVESNLTANRLQPEWPPTSLYYPVHTYIEKTVNLDWNMMPSSQFAERLVSKLTQKRKPAMVYLGSKLWLAYSMYFAAWCASWFVGVRFWDLVMGGPFGMVELKRIVRERERSRKKVV
jgi:1-acylglycerone phosphate reductase